MRTILIIEDDAALRKALGIGLRQQGYAVVEAANGAAGLREFAGRQPDLVLTDLIMPEVEGLEVIVELRRRNPSLPVVAMSGGGRNRSESYLQIAGALGARRVFAKPFQLEELCTAIDEILRPLSN